MIVDNILTLSLSLSYAVCSTGRRLPLFSSALEHGIKEVRHNLDTLYRHNAIVLSDFDRLMLALKGECQRTKAFDLQKLLTAIDFAALKHQGQTRIHADWVPYLIHPLRVTLVLFSEGGIVEEDLLAAALLHDTLEDTRTLPEEIVTLFGARVLSLVEELTEVPGQSIANCKMSLESKIIKLADRAHNLRDLIDHPPKIWRKDKVENFLQRSRELLQTLKGSHPVLEKKYSEALDALEKFNQS